MVQSEGFSHIRGATEKTKSGNAGKTGRQMLYIWIYFQRSFGKFLPQYISHTDAPRQFDSWQTSTLFSQSLSWTLPQVSHRNLISVNCQVLYLIFKITFFRIVLVCSCVYERERQTLEVFLSIFGWRIMLLKTYNMLNSSQKMLFKSEVFFCLNCYFNLALAPPAPSR